MTDARSRPLYADPKNIYELLNSQTTRIREQDAEIERLKAEVERLRKLAPWCDSPQVEITAGMYSGWKGRLVHEGDGLAYVVLDTESMDDVVGMIAKYVTKGHIKYITQEA